MSDKKNEFVAGLMETLGYLESDGRFVLKQLRRIAPKYPDIPILELADTAEAALNLAVKSMSEASRYWGEHHEALGKLQLPSESNPSLASDLGCISSQVCMRHTIRQAKEMLKQAGHTVEGSTVGFVGVDPTKLKDGEVSPVSSEHKINVKDGDVAPGSEATDFERDVLADLGLIDEDNRKPKLD